MAEIMRRGFPGMKSAKDLPVLQDGPPPGGYPSIRYGRKIPNTGPTGSALFLAATAMIMYGFYRVAESNAKRRAFKEEVQISRIAILPFLQAEEDERFCAKRAELLKQEAEIMKDVPDWKVGESVYNGKRWMPPAKPVGVWSIL